MSNDTAIPLSQRVHATLHEMDAHFTPDNRARLRSAGTALPLDAYAALAAVRPSERNRHERASTCRIKFGLHETHRDPSAEMPPPGTIMCTCGWCVSAEPQLALGLLGDVRQTLLALEPPDRQLLHDAARWLSRLQRWHAELREQVGRPP